MAIRWDGRAKPFGVLVVDTELLEKRGALARLRPAAVELRLDLLRKVDGTKTRNFLRSARAAKASILVTARRRRDGGIWPLGHERARLEALAEHAPMADAIDLEANLTEKCLKETVGKIVQLTKWYMRPAIILSHHDLKRVTPDSTARALYARAVSLGAARFKIAVMPKNLGEAERFCALALDLARGKVPVTAIAMGPYGRWTRWILPRILGGPSYASLGGRVAPGQIPYAELTAMLPSSGS